MRKKLKKWRKIEKAKENK